MATGILNDIRNTKSKELDQFDSIISLSTIEVGHVEVADVPMISAKESQSQTMQKSRFEPWAEHKGLNFIENLDVSPKYYDLNMGGTVKEKQIIQSFFVLPDILKIQIEYEEDLLCE